MSQNFVTSSNQLLLQLAEKGKATVLQHLLNQLHCTQDMTHLDVNFESTKTGHTALMLASGKGYQEAVSFLIENGASVNMKTSAHRRTALMTAAYYNQANIVHLLVANGAILDAQDLNGTTALISACNEISLATAATVGAILSYGADPNLTEKYGYTALHHVCMNDIYEIRHILEMLLSSGADINAIDVYQYTAIMYAAENGQLNAVQSLISLGADLNVTCKISGFNALSLAWDNKHAEIARILIQNGANVKSPFLTPLSEEIQRVVSECWQSTPIHKAVYADSSGEIADLLKFSFHDLHCRDQLGWTPLHTALFLKRIECIQILIANGADVFATTSRLEYTSLHLACFRGDMYVINLLLTSLQHMEGSNSSFSKKLRNYLE